MGLWIRDRLLHGENLVGTFLQVPAGAVSEVVADSGVFDVLCVEGEHSQLSVRDVADLVRTAEARGVPCLVRVAANDLVHVSAALDAGAVGVLVPRIESGAEAGDSCRWARFPPEGVRGFGPSRATGFGVDASDYVAQARANTLVGVQVETRAGVDRLDGILEVDGVDLVFVGPADLALSFGLDPVQDVAELGRHIDGILDRVVQAGKLSGIFASTSEMAREWSARGVSLVLLGSDIGFLRDAVRREKHVLER